jgi:hypothetical protein
MEKHLRFFFATFSTSDGCSLRSKTFFLILFLACLTLLNFIASLKNKQLRDVLIVSAAGNLRQWDDNDNNNDENV